MYVDAEIVISGDSVYAIQQDALVRKGSAAYVLAESGNSYEIIEVDTGATMDGWIEIRNYQVLRDKNIVTEGASRLFTALRR